MDSETNMPERTTAEAVKDVTEAGQQLFAAGERIAGDLGEIQRRIERATDWRAQFDDYPGMFLGAAFIGGLLLAAIVPPRRR